jgi:hypothetical protein
MPLEGQRGITTRHALAVVADPNQPEASVFDLNGNRATAGIEAVFE